MKYLFLILFLAISITAVAQDFAKGYYIDAAGRHDNVFFKKRDFFNYNSLKAATTANGEYIALDPETITEYGIENDIKFQKFTVSIDHSKLNSNDIGNVKEPHYSTDTVFLNVIVEGDASLYAYLSDEGTKYFYSVKSKNIPVTQLLYKTYMAKQQQIGENNYYRQQLFNDVKCNGQLITEFSNVRYDKNELTKIIGHFNQCTGSTNTTFDSKKSIVKFKYTLFAGAGTTTFSLDRSLEGLNDVSKTAPHAGVEIAMLLPQEKWAFFLRGDYDGLKGTMKRTVTTAYRLSTDSFNFNLHFYNVYIGPRYNFKWGQKNKLFADASLAVAIASGNLTYSHVTTTIDGTVVTPSFDFLLNTNIFYNVGIGYTYNNKYGIDLRMNTNRDFIDHAYNEKPNLTTVSLNLRYTIN